MDNIVQIILAIVGSSAVTSLVTLRSKRRTGDTESYKMLLDDLNQRLAANIIRTQQLETENQALRVENTTLRSELQQLRLEIAAIKERIK